MKGIIYCRVSSTDQIKGTSLDNQQKACSEYADMKGISIVKIFIEKGESATAADRTELIKALEYCREHKEEIAAFIVWKIDRFARNTIDHFGLQAQLSKYGTKLHSVTEPINEGPIGKMTEAVLAGYAQFENDIRKQRCEGGMQRRIAEGINPWQPPIGYIHSKKRTDRRKTQPDQPDPERFYLIQKGLRTYSAGNCTITELTRLYNEWGLKTRTGKPVFIQMVERILKNKFYAGILTNPWTKEEHRGLHEPMITEEEFYQIQRIKAGLSNGATTPRTHLHQDFPLRGLISCTCGIKYTSSWRSGRSKKYPYYHCYNKNCQHYTHAINKKLLEDKFIDFLKRTIPTDDFLKAFRIAVIDLWKDEHTSLENMQKTYEKKIKTLEEKRRNLVSMRIEGEISKEEFAILKNTLENELVGVKISVNETTINKFDIEAALNFTEQLISNLPRQWQEMNTKQKQRLQKLVLPEGITFDKMTETFGTAVLSPIFMLSQHYTGIDSQLVAGAGFAPAISRFLCTFYF